MEDTNLNVKIDNTYPQFLIYYENEAEEVFNNDIHNIVKFIGYLFL